MSDDPWDDAEQREMDYEAGRAEVMTALGEALSRTRLAMTALDLGDATEANGVLSALCGYLVEHGAIDPDE